MYGLLLGLFLQMAPSYVFIPESHDDPVAKERAVAVASSLRSRGMDVGLYVEAIPSDCDVSSLVSCDQRILRFDPEGYASLVASGVPVYGIDEPTWSPDRIPYMASVLRSGPTAVKVVLAGRAHVRDAYGVDARYDGLCPCPYQNPGDLVEEFGKEEVVVVE